MGRKAGGWRAGLAGWIGGGAEGWAAGLSLRTGLPPQAGSLGWGAVPAPNISAQQSGRQTNITPAQQSGPQPSP